METETELSTQESSEAMAKIASLLCDLALFMREVFDAICEIVKAFFESDAWKSIVKQLHRIGLRYRPQASLHRYTGGRLRI